MAYSCCQCDALISERCALCGHYRCANCRRDEALLPSSTSETKKAPTELYYSSQKALQPPIARLEKFNRCAAFKKVAEYMNRILRSHDQEWLVVLGLGCHQIRKFVESQLDGSWDLDDVLVLSGTPESAYATTCSEYVKFAWGEWGLDVFHEILNKCRDYGSTTMQVFDGLQCEITRLPPDSTIVIAKGKGESIYLLATLISWMKAVFIKPPLGTPFLRGVEPSFYKAPYLLEEIDKAHLSSSTEGRRFGYRIFCGNPKPIKSSNGACWIPLFQHCVMAEGYPVPDRTEEIGVEVSFDVMVQLGRISYSLELPQGMILKGHSTMLIPSLSPSGIQWHFIGSSKPGSYISVDAIPENLRLNIPDLEPTSLSQRRCFIGYYSEAHVHVGTRDSGYEKLELSQAECNPTTIRIGREINPSIGTGGMSIFGGGIGAKVIFAKGLYAPIEMEEACLEDRLLNSKDNATIIYDVEKKTGFLVPELSAVLQIAHSWASRQSDGHQLLIKMPFVDPSNEAGQCAYEAVMKNKGLVLREAYADEKELFFITKLKEIFRALEKRKEQQRLVRDGSTRMIDRCCIQGWEIYDIAASKPSYEKRIKLPLRSTESWHKVPRENPDMIVLLSKGMGDVIRPGLNTTICKAWYPLPQENYLLVSSECVRSLSRRHGGVEEKPRFGAKLYLEISRGNSLLGNCEPSKNGGCNHAQSLRTSPPAYNVFLKNGAILFGKSTSRK